MKRSALEMALLPTPQDGPRVSLVRGDVTSPGMVSTEPGDVIGSPIDGPAVSGSGAVLTIDGHRLFIPYGAVTAPEVVEQVQQLADIATGTQDAVSETHTTAVDAAEQAEVANAAVDAAMVELAAAQDAVEAANTAATAALAGADAAVHVANLAEAAAQGIVKVERFDPGHYPGRIWYQTNASGQGIGVKVSKSGSWVPYMLVADQVLVPSSVGSVLIANGAITAPKLHVDALNFKKATGLDLTSGTITGALLRTAENGPRLEITTQGLSRYRSDGEGSLIRTVNIGGDDADELALYDAQGRLLSGLMADGSAAVRGQLAVGDLLVGGERFDAHLPRGILTAWRGIQNWHTAASSEIGIVQLRESIIAGRIYRFHFSGGFTGSQANDLLALRVRVGAVGLDTNATVTSPLIGAAYHSTRAGAFHGDLNAYWMADRSGRVPFLFSFLRLAGVGTIQHTAASATPAMAWIEDCGTPTGDGKAGYTLGGGYPHTSAPSEPVNEPETMVRTYNAAWTRSWRGSGIVSDFLHHGTYGGITRRSMIGFPAQVGTDLAGATINKVEIYLENQHWYYGSGGTAYITPTTHTSAPASPPATGAPFTEPWSVGAGKWVTVPAGAWTASHRAIILGHGAPTSLSAYGKFTNSLSTCRLRVTYTK